MPAEEDDEDWPPLYDEKEFDEFVNRLVAMEQPRAFALVAELGVRADAQVIGWGLQFAEHVDVALTDGRTRLSFSTLDRVVRVLSSRGTVRVVYLPVDPLPDD
ncbi:hypothetical protein [Fodinicola acaciae]|uniref:hypothetical protein n=1 Tax=Fodinicola acaciae TaxID=2681555 RepID=UPI0013D7790F|nr:hypothetical protein [Fodinicola acaciae]